LLASARWLELAGQASQVCLQASKRWPHFAFERRAPHAAAKLDYFSAPLAACLGFERADWGAPALDFEQKELHGILL
jgi:hypothetical protein